MTTVDDAAQQLGADREGLLAHHPLVFFFIMVVFGRRRHL